MDKDKIFVIGFAKFEIKNDGLEVKIWVKIALTCQKNGKVAKFEIKNGK